MLKYTDNYMASLVPRAKWILATVFIGLFSSKYMYA